MKNIIIFACAFCVLAGVAYSATPASLKLNTIEKKLFGYEYQNETENNRVIRIEKYLYGKTFSTNINSRLSKISSDLGIVDNNSLASKNSSLNKKTAPYEKEDASVQYPIVDKMESMVFGKSFNGENIYSRLDKLEKSVFKTTNNDNLSNRVNKLRLAVIDSAKNTYDNIASSHTDYLSDAYSSSSIYGQNNGDDNFIQQKTSPNNDSSFTYKSPKTSRNNTIDLELTAIEQNILNQTYQADSTENRLNRLEAKIFKRNFNNDTKSTRIQRIAAVNTAQKSAKSYDNNKLSRNLSTGMQIGGFLLMILAMIL